MFGIISIFLHLPFRQIFTILLPTCRCVVSGPQTSLNAADCPEIPVLEQLEFNLRWFGRNGLAAVADFSMGVGLCPSIQFGAISKLFRAEANLQR